MARSGPMRAGIRSLIWLAVIVIALIVVLGAGRIWGDAGLKPKLALDLQGGTQLILTPKLAQGQSVTQDQLDQAVAIIRQRVDSAGVSEAEVSSQGGAQIVVSIPGTPSDDTLQRIESAARLVFRPVIYADSITDQTTTDTPTPGATPTPTTNPEPGPDYSPTASPAPTNASDPSWVNADLLAAYNSFDCSALNDPSVATAPDDKPFLSCDPNTGEKFILGPVEVDGSSITNATSGLIPGQNGTSTNDWGVFITFDAKGTQEFADVTKRLYGYPATNADGSPNPQNRFAMVLDGEVISAPTTNAVITDGRPQISGNFTQQSAASLAGQLKSGSLPISFSLESSEAISATLGSASLISGLIAGLIGLFLVLIYSLFQYRMLGFVTIASLVLMGILTYLAVAILSWQNGYSLSLAGVAGLIVSIGFTADSFIVYFERIRDELRDGRTLPGAVEAGWRRALRTILSAKFINLLSAIVLYVLAIGSVRGFAFTLGLTTVIDVVVVLLFTHPVMQLVAQNRFFASGHPLSGLDPQALGAVYRGRAEFRFSAEKRRAGASREAVKRQTIAERKAAELASTSAGGKDDARASKGDED